MPLHTNVKFSNQGFYDMRCFVVFVTAVCFLFLLKLKWPKIRVFDDLINLVLRIFMTVGKGP